MKIFDAIVEVVACSAKYGSITLLIVILCSNFYGSIRDHWCICRQLYFPVDINPSVDLIFRLGDCFWRRRFTPGWNPGLPIVSTYGAGGWISNIEQGEGITNTEQGMAIGEGKVVRGDGVKSIVQIIQFTYSLINEFPNKRITIVDVVF